MCWLSVVYMCLRTNAKDKVRSARCCDSLIRCDDILNAGRDVAKCNLNEL